MANVDSDETNVMCAYSIPQLQEAYIKATPQKLHSQIKEFFKQPGIFVNTLKSKVVGIGLSTEQTKYIPWIPAETLPIIHHHMVVLANADSNSLNQKIAAILNTFQDYPIDWTYCMIDGQDDYKDMLKILAGRNGKIRAQQAAIDNKHLLDMAKSHVKDHIFVALDIEAYEQDHDILTEVGWTMWDPRKPPSSAILSKHCIIEENKRYRNSIWVPDHRLDYLHNESKTRSLDYALAHLMADMKNRKVALIGHELKSDLEFLKTWSYDLEKCCDAIHDTRDLYLVVSGNDKASLGAMCQDLGISTRYMHNAGNDAYATMMAFKSLVTA
ncbi:hypothetical protein HDU86_000119 [Geranomyces michiganensis]|nr:hypothetical protein HDU86_000119 [Geranomyces michiganensis]